MAAYLARGPQISRTYTEELESEESDHAIPEPRKFLVPKKNVHSDSDASAYEMSKKILKLPRNRNFHMIIKRMKVWVPLLGVLSICMAAGHLYCSIIIIALNIYALKEFALSSRSSVKQREFTSFDFILWYFVTCTVYYMYGPLVYQHLSKRFAHHEIMIKNLTIYHRLICFLLILTGLIGWVLSIKKKKTGAQFNHFSWFFLTLFCFVGGSYFVILNLYQGLIWVILPAIVAVINSWATDLFAFFRSSKKKNSKEASFVGLLVSVIFSFYIVEYLTQYQELVCPQYQIDLEAFKSLTCERSSLYNPIDVVIPAIYPLNREFDFRLSGFQMHAIVIATMASLMGPVSRFFNSAIRRAKIKAPGEGFIQSEVTKRLFFQIAMGLFIHLWITHVIRSPIAYPSIHSHSIVEQFISLADEDKRIVLEELIAIMAAQGKTTVSLI
eukprot:CAMPEP_0114974556 /NCGR_PEP_ID=MMETSP0216-20121206/1591_1 /TAXON_ID=223996 /ORGANISM="Protocruzia adherens, Strain Boccale" /LENGTH=440 /DNA_ID=CAMNT_0002335203 /DNA_START=47 /DNA_END=1369 /DNA_ORIENTATION=-